MFVAVETGDVGCSEDKGCMDDDTGVFVAVGTCDVGIVMNYAVWMMKRVCL